MNTVLSSRCPSLSLRDDNRADHALPSVVPADVEVLTRRIRREGEVLAGGDLPGGEAAVLRRDAVIVPAMIRERDDRALLDCQRLRLETIIDDVHDDGLGPGRG